MSRCASSSSCKGVGAEQRDVAGGDDDRAVEVVGEGTEAALHGVAGAELFLLDGHQDLAAETRGDGAHLGGDLLAAVPTTVTRWAGPSAAAAYRECASIVRPPRVCNTFGVFDRILVPAPAASTTIAVCTCM
ncbi:hypothetical protein NJ76_10590 [Rhodococcus sp. IITR03]|nr:hypothetical protein NJ76_10590 [Rhodococcus sp. IITR03]